MITRSACGDREFLGKKKKKKRKSEMLTVTVAPAKISYLRSLPSWPSNTTTPRFLKTVNCSPPLQQQVQEEQQQVFDLY